MSKNWYKPTFWRWWGQAQAPAEAKVLAHRAGRIAFGVAAGGYVAVGSAIATIG